MPSPDAPTLFDLGSNEPHPARKPSAVPYLPSHPTLPAIRTALPGCRGCDLYLHATQAVPGHGPSRSPLLIVGEQPGDQEDLAGLPFVGPAGKVLDRACEEAGIDPATLYITNAVKHFKFVQRGKLRLHQTPRASEVTACRPWLLAEIEAVRPNVILCLGASAAKSLLGPAFSVTRDRGRFDAAPFAAKVMATYHPSAILRAPDPQAADDLFHFLRTDLALAYKTALTP